MGKMASEKRGWRKGFALLLLVLQHILLPAQEKKNGHLNSAPGAFTAGLPAETPEQVVSLDLDPGHSIQVHVYEWENRKKHTRFSLRYNDFYPGTVIANDSLYFGEMKSLLVGERMLITERAVWLDACPGREFISQDGEEQKRSRVYIRNSRIYVLEATYPARSANDPAIERFINSLQFTAYEPTVWKTFDFPGDDFSAKYPSQPEVVVDSTGNGPVTHYNSIDPNTGTSYMLTAEYLPEYYTAKNEDALWSDILLNGKDELDSVLYMSILKTGTYPACEVIISNADEDLVRRGLVVVAGMKVYKLFAYFPKQEVMLPANKIFFTSFKPAEGIKETVFADKKPQLFADLDSNDPAKMAKAIDGISSMEFTKNDLPGIYRTLKKEYNGNNEVLTAFFDILPPIADAGTVKFIEDLYPQLPAVADVQLRALSVLTSINTKPAIAAFGRLITKYPLKQSTSYRVGYVFAPLYDTLQNAKVLFPSLLQLLNDPALGEAVLKLAAAARDSNVIAQSTIAPYKQDIIKSAVEESAKRKTFATNDERFNSTTTLMEALANALSLFNEPNTEKVLNTMLQDSAMPVKLAAAGSLIRMRKEVKSETLELLAADTEYRLELYKMLQKLHREELFPQKYFSQLLFAESNLAVWLSYKQDELPRRMEFISKRQVKYMDQLVNVYLFKFAYPNEMQELEWFVGISGPQPADESKVSLSRELTGTDYAYPQEKSIDEHFDSLVKELSF